MRAQTITGGSITGATITACIPFQYCASRADFSGVGAIGNFSAAGAAPAAFARTTAGTSVIDGYSGGTICQLTDATHTGINNVSYKGADATWVSRIGAKQNDGSHIISLEGGGGIEYLMTWKAPCTLAYKGGISGAIVGSGGQTNIAWWHTDPFTFYSMKASDPNIKKNVINPNAAAWTANSGFSVNVDAAITATNALDLSSPNAYGALFDRNIYNAYLYVPDAADRYATGGIRYRQDYQYLIHVCDLQLGNCWILDTRQWKMTANGGFSGFNGVSPSAANFLLPAPAAPSLSQSNCGGSLATHQYSVKLRYVDNLVGHSTTGAASNITLTGGNNCITITAPTASPANTVKQATGYEVCVNDETSTPGASCHIQADGANPTAVLGQPTLAMSCSGGCNGSTTITYWLYCSNADGDSPLSTAQALANADGSNNVVATIGNSTGATSCTLAHNHTYQILNLGGSTSSQNINDGNGSDVIAIPQTTPTSRNAQVTSYVTTTETDDGINATGTLVHSNSSDITGHGRIWFDLNRTTVQTSLTGSASGIVPIVNISTGVITIVTGCSTGTCNPPAGLNICTGCRNGHEVMGSGLFFSNDVATGKPSVWTISDNAATMQASQAILVNQAITGANQDNHFTILPEASSVNNPVYIGFRPSSASHAIDVSWQQNNLAAFRVSGGDRRVLCANYSSSDAYSGGTDLFPDLTDGNISFEGDVWLFPSDMGIGNAGSDPLGGSDGSATGTWGSGGTGLIQAFLCIPPVV